MKIVLLKERPMSWNSMYSGNHWSVRKTEADRVHSLVKYSISPKDRKFLPHPVNVLITAYFKDRPYDSDNICAKFYVDGLKGIVIENDTPEFVGFVATRSEMDKKNPRVEIEID